MIVTIPTDRVNKVKAACQKLLNLETVTIRQLAEVVGMLVALEPGADFAPIYYRRAEIFKTDMLRTKKGNFDAKVDLSAEVKADLVWWREHVATVERKITRERPRIEITSDSSDFAWGGTCSGVSTGGPWNAMEKLMHINVKELKAVFLTLKTFCGDKTDVHIRLKIDNMTSVSYINKQGGKKPFLNSIARDIWQWAIDRNIWLSATHIPGVLNESADKASRLSYELETEWQLNTEVFQDIEHKFGPFDLDLFASRINTCSASVSSLGAQTLMQLLLTLFPIHGQTQKVMPSLHSV